MMHEFLKQAKNLLNSQVAIDLILCCLIMLSIQNMVDAKITYIYNGSIYVMNDNGSGIRRLTDNQYWEGGPHWSPDGTKIAFERNLEKDTQRYQLFIMDADGTNQQQLTYSNEGTKNGSPAWSPDGRYLAFKSNRSGRVEIHVMDMQTQNITQLTGIEEETGSHSPHWSPDGTKIAFGRFVSKPGLSHKTIWVMSADGKNQKPFLPEPLVTEPSLFRAYPNWAPDGKQILFIETRGFQDEREKFFVIQSGNGRRTEIDINKRIGGRWVGSGVCWMDDGRAILFSAGRLDVPDKDRYHDVYRYEITSRNLKRLTTYKYHDVEPDWIEGPLPVSPQGKLPTQWGDIKAIYGVK